MMRQISKTSIFFIVVLCLSFLLLNSCEDQSRLKSEPIDYVDPFIGAGGHGHVFVGANVPFGAVQVGPNNIYKGWDWCSGYHYSDSLIIGFSQLHLSGTGIGDLGDVLIMPYTGEIKLDKGRQKYPHGGYLSTFSHENETAKPGYYSVIMDNGVKVELAATERVGFHRYYFPKDQQACIIINLKDGINDRATKTSFQKVDDHTLLGTRFSSGWAREQQVYFAIRSSIPIEDLKLFDDTLSLGGTSAEAKAIKAVISFKKAPECIDLKVGISPVSVDNALSNIDAEIPEWDFYQVVESARKKWNKELSKIKIETSDESKKRIFYTALFHSFIHPSLFNDHNGEYQEADNKIHTNPSFNNYTVLSTWDTYRAEHPLFALIQPERMNDFVNTMLAIFDEEGSLPVWHLSGYETGTMVGISSLQIIAEAYLKGYRGFDAERAYQAIKSTAMSDQRGLSYLRDLKPAPSDVHIGRVVAQAMELSIADGSIALMAKVMGKEDDYEYFSKRAKNYQLYYDKNVGGFFHGKMSDGSWKTVFDPLKSTRPYANDYAEGNAWQYLWLAPQDVHGLIDLMGGDDAFTARLDSFFTIKNKDSEVLADLTGLIGQYAHGNEPSHHIAYLYTFAGQQWKSAEKVRYIMDEFYHDDPDGVIGNEDCGQMSAWYVFSSMGFYPVFPASLKYVLGSPLFDKVEVRLEGGKTFIVEAENNSDENKYIQSVELNGQPYSRSFITHQDVVDGGTLKIMMGNNPNYNYGK